MLGVSALHYSTGSQDMREFQTVAPAHVLCQPTIVHLSISIISVWKFRVMLSGFVQSNTCLSADPNLPPKIR